jgi:predicted transcriptional regulator
MTLKERILWEYAQLKVVHPTYQEIANKVGCTKAYVHRIIKASTANGDIKAKG